MKIVQQINSIDADALSALQLDGTYNNNRNKKKQKLLMYQLVKNTQ